MVDSTLTHEEVAVVVALLLTNLHLRLIVSGVPGGLGKVFREELALLVEVVACSLSKMLARATFPSVSYMLT